MHRGLSTTLGCRFIQPVSPTDRAASYPALTPDIRNNAHDVILNIASAFRRGQHSKVHNPSNDHDVTLDINSASAGIKTRGLWQKGSSKTITHRNIICGQAWRRTKILSQNKYLTKCEQGKKNSSDLFLKFWLYSQNWILIFFSHH